MRSSTGQKTAWRAALAAFRGTVATGVTAVAILASATASAQTLDAPTVPPPDLKKWDATGTIGWYNRPLDGGPYASRTNAFFAGATLGRYWTENLKTELEVATGGNTEGLYWDQSFPIAGYAPPANLSVSNLQVTVGQLYQFFHNQWFHPFVGAGAVFERQRFDAVRAAQQYPTYSYVDGKPVSQVVSIPSWSAAWTESTVSPFVLAGFKAYTSHHTFFRADLRVATRNGMQSVNTRIGFGVDF